MLTVHKCSDTGLFRHLSNPASCSLEFQKQITFEAHLFFKVFKILWRFWKLRKKMEKVFFHLEIISFELVALNTRFYWERILVTGFQYVNKSCKISDTSKTELFELILFQSHQKIWQNYCHGDLSSVSDLLTCWLSISALTRVSLGI